MTADRYDAVVVGGGPNGLAAAITLARAGRSVALFEAETTIGGGMRSAELTLPGFVHDVCSAIHPLARASPFFSTLGLERHGLEWIEPPISLAHPLDDGSAALVRRDLDETAASLGRDGAAYRRLVGPTVGRWDALIVDVLAPFHIPLRPRPGRVVEDLRVGQPVGEHLGRRPVEPIELVLEVERPTILT
ncbi:MAG: NAD(P)/FAD-dependent oxidoreductase, partial [Myxococcales bacterium]|nr:NAD(P)/FAD-dependent oxidoreductase [Myxococcales bacterium]